MRTDLASGAVEDQGVTVVHPEEQAVSSLLHMAEKISQCVSTAFG